VIEFGSENYGTQSALQTYLRTVDEFDLRIVTLLWIHQTQHWIPFFRQRKWLGTWSELITEAIQDHGDKNYSDLFGDRPSGAVRPAILWRGLQRAALTLTWVSDDGTYTSSKLCLSVQVRFGSCELRERV
jgi:hypothetical protein